MLAQSAEAKDKGYKTEHIPSLAELEAAVDKIDAEEATKKAEKEEDKKGHKERKGLLQRLYDKSGDAIKEQGG